MQFLQVIQAIPADAIASVDVNEYGFIEFDATLRIGADEAGVPPTGAHGSEWDTARLLAALRLIGWASIANVTSYLLHREVRAGVAYWPVVRPRG